MSSYNNNRFRNGVQPESGNDNPPAMLIHPNITGLQNNNKELNPYGLKNISGSHDAVFDTGDVAETGATGRTALRGTKILRAPSPFHPEVMTYQYEDSSALVPSTLVEYVEGSGASGQDFTNPETTDPSLAAITAPWLSHSPNENFMMFVCAFVDAADSSVLGEGANNIGFDVGGYFNDVSNAANDITGGCGIRLGNPITASGALNSTIAATSTWNGYWDSVPDLIQLPNKKGVVAKAVSVNGTSGGLSYRIHTGEDISTGIDFTDLRESGLTLSGAAGTGWSDVNTMNPVYINLGWGCSKDTGVYFMGIRNYAAPIPDAEVRATAQFMQKTGLLPPWWKLN